MPPFRYPGTTCLSRYGLLADMDFLDDGTMSRSRACSPADLLEPFEETPPSNQDNGALPAEQLTFGEQGAALLKGVESLRLKPYDDQTQKDITAWVAGATVGYGHLIKSNQWNTYKDGIDEDQADALFDSDLAPFVSAVQTHIKAAVTQNQFDALVILAFNIGAGATGFAGSSVVKLVNDPTAQTAFSSLEAAWKVWNKSQGKVNKGLNNRRQCEWNIYSQGIYKRW